MDQQHDDPATRPLPLGAGGSPHPGAAGWPSADRGRPGGVGPPRRPEPTGVGRAGGERGSGTYRYVVVAASTLVALAVVALVGVLLYPRVAPVAATVAAPAVAAAPVPSPAATSSAPTVVRVPSSPRTVIVPAPTTTDEPSGGGYSCGSVDGYAIHVNNGNVPCTSARLVTAQWTSSGTTPSNGEGDAGTPFSWTCTSAAPAAVGFCTSKLGSTFTIDA